MTIFSLFKYDAQGSLYLSKLVRRVFERKNIKFILGSWLVLMSLVLGAVNPISTVQGQEALIPKPQENTLTELNFQKPVLGRISQTYHWYHQGIDICADFKAEIKPITGGQVLEANFSAWGYGKKIMIGHENGFVSLYAHLNEILVKAGDLVTKETLIGTVGLTGWTSGPHLHLEIIKNGKSVNPQEVLPDYISINLASSSAIPQEK